MLLRVAGPAPQDRQAVEEALLLSLLWEQQWARQADVWLPPLQMLPGALAP